MQNVWRMLKATRGGKRYTPRLVSRLVACQTEELDCQSRSSMLRLYIHGVGLGPAQTGESFCLREYLVTACPLNMPSYNYIFHRYPVTSWLLRCLVCMPFSLLRRISTHFTLYSDIFQHLVCFEWTGYWRVGLSAVSNSIASPISQNHGSEQIGSVSVSGISSPPVTW